MKKSIPKILILILILSSAAMARRRKRRKSKKRYNYQNSQKYQYRRQNQIKDAETFSLQDPPNQAQQPQQKITVEDLDYQPRRGRTGRNRRTEAENHQREQKQAKEYYDHYVWAVQWARSICDLRYCKYNTNRGQVFNIHGLWPSSSRRRQGPHKCEKGHFSWKTVDSGLHRELETHWSGLFGSRKLFNNHEWEKHGTCLDPFKGNLEKMPNLEIKEIVQNYRKEKVNKHVWYFRLSIALNKHYELKQTFANCGILPNKESRAFYDFFDCIQEQFGIRGFFARCDKAPNTKIFYLSEIRFCLDLDFNLVNCKRGFRTNCSDEIHYH
jgi:ribonuclease I